MSVVSIQNAEHYIWGDGCDGWHLLKTDTLSVIQECVPCGAKEIRHYHNTAEQFFFVLSGIATLEVDGKIHKISPQNGLHVPATIPHQLKNQHTEDLIFIVTSSPPSHGDRIELEQT